MSENVKAFNNIYNQIKVLLGRRLGKQDQYDDFSALIKKAKNEKIISDEQYFLLEKVGKLRNSIIHEEKFAFPDDAIAEPHFEIINMMDKVKNSLEKPVLLQDFRKTPPAIFNQDDSLSDCLKSMRDNNYSQLVVKFDKGYGLFTREDEAKWFEEQAKEDELILSFKEHKIKDLKSLDLNDQCMFISKTATAIELIHLFQQNPRPDMAAVLVTENGRSTEKPLKIFTHWDLPEIYKKLEGD